MRYARLAPGPCRAELARLGVSHRLEKLSAKNKRPGDDVITPLRLEGSLHGVAFKVPAPPSPFGKLDCRLAVALDSMAELLARYDVVGVRVDNMYRPGAVIAGKKKPSQHARGLAIDIMAFELAGGDELSVKRDWHGVLGKPYCGPDAVLLNKSKPAALELRNLVCEVIRSGLFHHTVTPSDNRAHRDHLHFDLDQEASRVQVTP